MIWSMLVLAVAGDVLGTLCLRMAAGRFAGAWFAATAILYVVGIAALGGALRLGMAVSVAYAIWASLGITLVTIAGAVLFHDRLTAVQIAGMTLVVAGVVMLHVAA